MKPLYDACQNTLKDGETCGNEKSVKAEQSLFEHAAACKELICKSKE